MIRILSPESGQGHIERDRRFLSRKGVHEEVFCLEARDHAMDFAASHRIGKSKTKETDISAALCMDLSVRKSRIISRRIH